MKTSSHSINSASEESDEIILFQGHASSAVQHTIRRPGTNGHQKRKSSTRGCIINDSHQTDSSNKPATTWNHFDGPRLVDFQALFGQNSSTPPPVSNKYAYHNVNNNQEDKDYNNNGQHRISLPTSDTLFSWTPDYNQLWTPQYHVLPNAAGNSPTWNAVTVQSADPLVHMPLTSMANQ
jgi:hypothetical protein